jgi:hypothetical protein
LAGTVILSALPLLIVEMFPDQLKFTMVPASYLVFHNIAEFFSIVVSLSMFGAEKAPNRTQDVVLKFLDAQFPFLYIHLTPWRVLINSRPESSRSNFDVQRSAK